MRRFSARPGKTLDVGVPFWLGVQLWEPAVQPWEPAVQPWEPPRFLTFTRLSLHWFERKCLGRDPTY